MKRLQPGVYYQVVKCIDRQVLTKGLQRMRRYLTEEHDLAPYKDFQLLPSAPEQFL